MTTARKPRSTTAARNTTVAPESSSAKRTATTKARSKPRKTTKKSAAAPAHEPVLTGSVIGAAAVQKTATETSTLSAALQGGTAPAVRSASPDALHRMIAEAAYYRAERRGFAPGGEEMDWFQAEAEVRRLEGSA